ncbi:MAG: ribosome silencing factor [Geminicoccaceae bacterium]
MTITAVSHAFQDENRLLSLILASLEDDKAVDPTTISLIGKSTMADHMVIATGTSQRHLASMAEKLVMRLKKLGYEGVGAEGQGASDWVLIDAGDVIVHLFREEVRRFYNLEKLWGGRQTAERPAPSALAFAATA